MKLSMPLYNNFLDHIYSRAFACLCAREISFPHFTQGLILNPAPAGACGSFIVLSIDMTHPEDIASEEKILKLPVGYEGAIIYLEIGPITLCYYLQVTCIGFCIFDVYLTCTSGSFNNSVSEMVWLSALISLLLGCSLGFQPVSFYVFETLNRLLLPLWRITPNWTNACWKRKKRDASWPRGLKREKKEIKSFLHRETALATSSSAGW